MSESTLNYIGPVPDLLAGPPSKKPWWRRLPLPFLAIVAAPTVVTAVYYLLIASPQYVSEAKFIVRAANRAQPSSLGVALEGVGISAGQTDAFAVHEYIDSRDGLRELNQHADLARMLGRPGADFLTRYPRFWEVRSDETLFKAYEKIVTVGYDSTTGISTLRVKAYTPQDAHRISEDLLAGGERLVNRLNERAASNAVADAERARDDARQRLGDAQARLTQFRNNEAFIDPTLSARESSELIGGMLATLANLRAERSQIASEAPSSPQLPSLDRRITAYEAQISEEREKLAGNAGSLVPRISTYEDLTTDREFAQKELAEATASLVAAQQDARRQRLYLDRVVNPNLPDKAAEPRRILNTLAVFMSFLLLYGVGWLIWTGVKEHRQD